MNSPPFDVVLVANRGEIACRVIASAKKLGMRAIAVYSAADANAKHVAMADEAVLLGPPPAAQSYLAIEKIVEACRSTGAQAVHPGYGFLSENAAFARALEREGIAFVGPAPHAIEKMGDKIESKKLALEAGVSCVPGHADPIVSLEEARRVAGAIGYPVMIKAAAGGGGKGMRIAHGEGELAEGIERAQSEARSSFGDDRVFVEKFVTQPRHIEIQVLADGHGRVIHLGERECSIQRRHQKVIEESPSPFLDPETRARMGAQACALARAVEYRSAGTVEFIVDAEKNFYFLEMNTRLQVEHPVTELVTGVDLVEEMFKIAAGEPLSLRQEDVRQTGWAIEARVYAEEPEKGFLPSTGRIEAYVEPTGEGLRIDSGAFEGGDVSMFYDPMIAKLCAKGENREIAADRLLRAIDRFELEGPGHNLAFCADVLARPRFRSGALTTAFVEEEYGERFRPAPHPRARDLAAALAAMRLRLVRRSHRISDARFAPPPPQSYEVELGEERFVFRAGEPEEGGLWSAAEWLSLEGEAPRRVALDWRPGRGSVIADIAGARLAFQARPIVEGWRVRAGGFVGDARVRSQNAAELARRMPERSKTDAGGVVLSPMPGLIASIAVKAGDRVESGQILCVLEAMKMENALRAERAGVIEAIECEAGAPVAADQVLMRFAS